MASGRNHDRAILLFTPIWSAVGYHYAGLDAALVVGTAHFIGGWWLSPDLDLKSRPFLRWGFLKFLWLPYQNAIPHRSPLSHAPLLGSAIRLLYLSVLMLPFWLALPPKFYTSVTPESAIAFVVGVELSALNHLMLDGLIVPLPRAIRKRLS